MTLLGTVLRRVLLAGMTAGLVLGGLVGLGWLTSRSANTPSAHAAGHQEIDPSYANDTVVYMIGPHMITNPNPHLLAQAEPLYILAYPLNFNPTCTSTCAPQTLPSGYQPQCNPCFHPGL